ncbi:beta-1,3-glucanase family protein [Curtobacterium sp. RHCKG23]|uniref:Beta-1,3-glucanase family protein n=1 Tax=Curtobacterium citri TaxID=3055139 RepID=A0ABT7T8M0_9MICO|nr:beta-1,3-glucanase family protein [Curtobacterium citri]MDM7885920.1 beta-1,3-glucanase family protein [Curtobacterium citri]
MSRSVARTRTVLALIVAFIVALTSLSLSPQAAFAAGNLPFTVTNNSGLSDATYVYVMARDQASNKQGYVDQAGTWHAFDLPSSVPDGTPPPAAPDTSIPGPRSGGTSTIQLRQGLVAGRIYMSFHDKLNFFLTPDGLVEPAGWVASDPNHGTIYDWVEFARDGGNIFINTTMVDMFSVPISVSVHNADGSNETQGRLVAGGRNKIFQALKSYGWGDLIQYRDGSKLPVRAMAPIHGVEQGSISAGYFDKYVGAAWSYYTSHDLTVTTALGDFTGRVSGSTFTFKDKTGAVVGRFSPPSTTDIFACEKSVQPAGQPNETAALAIGARICAALNRGTLSTSSHQGSDTQATHNAADFYGPGVDSNLYSKAMHLAEANGNAYGFAFDDVAEFSPSINSGNPTTANMTVAPFTGGSSGDPGQKVTASVDSLFGHPTWSGFSDDPVNVATGNYTDDEAPLAYSSVWAPSVSMTYNSMDTRAGPFGTGWSSMLQEAVTSASNGDATVRWPDGSTLKYTRRSDGTFAAPSAAVAQLTRSSTGWATTRKDGSGETFDTAGRITALHDQNAHTVTLARNSSNQVTTITGDNHAQTITLTWAGSHITRATTADKRSATFTYNGASLSAITDPAGKTKRFGADSNGRLTTITDADSTLLVTNRYDANGRVIEQARPGSPTEQFAYDTANGTTDVTTADKSASMHYTFNADGRLLSTTSADGTTSMVAYDANGNPSKTTDRAGVESDSTYTADGQLQSQTTDGVTTTYEHDSRGRTTKVTKDGKTVAYTYGTSTIPTGATMPDGSKASFAVSGSQLTSSTDADGKTSRYTYTASGKVASITTPTGDTTSYTYDAAGNTTVVTAPGNRVTKYEYDAAGRQTKATAPSGGVTGTSYTAAGRVASTTDPDGATTAYTYDNAGRLSIATAADGGKTKYAYDTAGDLTTVTDPAGTATNYSYDGFGRVAKSTTGTQSTSYTYDANGRATLTATGAQSTSQQYDAAGNVISFTDANGAMTRYGYDSLGNQTRAIAADGTVTASQYDAVGNQTSVRDPLGFTSTATYSAAGLLTASTDPMGFTTHYGYDDAGRNTSVEKAGGHTWAYAYNAAGQVSTATSPTGLVTTYGYDADGNTTSVTTPGRGTTKTTYSPAGKVLTRTDANGAKSSFTYDTAGRLHTATDANGDTTTYAYDASGQLTKQTDPRGGDTSYTYDAAGQLTKKTDPLGRATTYTYDAAGNVLKETDPDGKATSFGYDATGQLLERTDPSGAKTTWAYNVTGQRTSMTDATGTTKYLYDADARLTKLDNPNGHTFNFTYDGDGRPATITYPDGTVLSYGRDADGNLAAVSDNHGNAVYYTVDADGRVTREGSAAGTVRTFTYLDGELSKYTEQLTTTAPTVTTEIGRGATGQVTSTLRDGQNTRYGYDAGGQLTSVDAPGTDDDQTYTYDDAGNRATKVQAGTTDSYVYDAANELTKINRGSSTRSTFTYDGAGRLASQDDADGSSLKLTYDGAAAPTKVSRGTAGGRTDTDLARDGDGVLTGIDTTGPDGSASTSLDWFETQGQLQPLTSTSDGTTTDFYYGSGSTRLQSAAGAAATDLSRDYLGSALNPGTDGAASTSYDAYGTGTKAPTGGFGYRGALNVDGLLMLGARAYDPSTGRFTATDPLGPVAGSAATTTPYPYANNDPLNLIDPLGLRATSDDAFNNAAAGFFDGVTFGLTRYGRQAAQKYWGWEDNVNYTSGSYKAGNVTGAVTGIVVVSVATGGTGGAVIAGAYVSATITNSEAAVLENRQASLQELGTNATLGAVTFGAASEIRTASSTVLAAGRLSGSAESIASNIAKVPAVGGESAAASIGRAMHSRFDRWIEEQAALDPKWRPGLRSGPNRPDGFYGSVPVELKPNTPSGLSKGRTQLRRYMNAFDSEVGYLYVYDDYGNFTLKETLK